MKETLRQNIERMKVDMTSRIEQLHKNIEEYKQTGDYENAMKCDLKRNTLLVVLERLNEALK